MQNTTKTIAKINDVSILLIENGDTYVPIRPICEALGIDEDVQNRKIKNDEILSSTATLRVAVAADKKEREMMCIPYMFVFGWLFTINPKNVKPEAKEAVAKYRMECYKALFKHFTDMSDFMKEKQESINKHVDYVDKLREDFKLAKTRMEKARDEMHKVRHMTFDDWKANNRQLQIPWPKQEEETEQ